jgi:hypothetical protein
MLMIVPSRLHLVAASTICPRGYLARRARPDTLVSRHHVWHDTGEVVPLRLLLLLWCSPTSEYTMRQPRNRPWHHD